MAIYHFSAQVISRSAGRSATAAAAYRSGEKIMDERTGAIHDYSQKTGIDHTEIMAPANAPRWVYDRAKLWNTAEQAEKRKDAQICREIEIALPVELNHAQQLELVRSFAQKHFVNIGMIADMAIHRTKAENPHCHILLSMRDISHEGFGLKNRGWNDKQLLETWREQWAEYANRALEQAGHQERIDHRTLEAQGIDRIPQIHIGPKVAEMEARGIRTERAEKALEIETGNEKIKRLQSELKAIRNERNPENQTSPQPGTNSRRFGAFGREHGHTGRPGTNQHPERGRSQPQARPGMERKPTPSSGRSEAGSGTPFGTGQEPATSHGLATSSGAGAGEGTTWPTLELGGSGPAIGHSGGSAGDRIRALAGAAPGPKRDARPASSSRTPQARPSGRAQAQNPPKKPLDRHRCNGHDLDNSGPEL
jgi:hypothetical protein